MFTIFTQKNELLFCFVIWVVLSQAQVKWVPTVTPLSVLPINPNDVRAPKLTMTLPWPFYNSCYTVGCFYCFQGEGHWGAWLGFCFQSYCICSMDHVFFTDLGGRQKENSDVHKIIKNIFYTFKGTFVRTWLFTGRADENQCIILRKQSRESTLPSNKLKENILGVGFIYSSTLATSFIF